MSEAYYQIQEALETKLLSAVELELGRDLTAAEIERVLSLVTDADVLAVLEGMA